MPEYTISQGDTEEIIAKDDDTAYRIRVFGAPVKITRTGDPRYSGDGLTYNAGYVGPIHNDGAARVFAKNTGSGPDAKIEIDSDLSAAGAFDPENAGTQTVTDDGNMDTNVTDRQGREIGKARLMDSSGTLIEPAEDGTLSSTLSREIASWTAGTLAVEQQTPVGVEDSTGTQVDPATSQQLANQSGVNFGQQTVATAGTAEALNGGTSLSVPDAASLTVRAEVASTGDHVYVGDSTVTSSDGFKLADGEGVTLDVDDVSTVHVDADTAGDGVSWVVEG